MSFLRWRQYYKSFTLKHAAVVVILETIRK